MSKDKSNKPDAGQNEKPKGGAEKVSATEWTERKRPVSRNFPGPRNADAPLRVACERTAYAEVIAHAKESLQSEICGALAGEVCEDDGGQWVEVKAAIRGSSARQGSTHVTFTQETWNAIHKTMEKDYPKLQIVGWYHSHPGFGVEFSEMDRFIQKNFFPAPTQIALVTDPLGGDVAICFNSPEGIRHLTRFWVDGREHQCRAPEEEKKSAGAGSVSADAKSLGKVQDDLRAIEARVGQLIQALDEQRVRSGRVLMTLFLLVLIGIVALIGWNIYHSYTSKFVPPRLNQYVQVPVQVGDSRVLLGVKVEGWEIPPEMDAMMLVGLVERYPDIVEKLLQQIKEEKKKASATNATTSATNAAPAAATDAAPAADKKP